MSSSSSAAAIGSVRRLEWFDVLRGLSVIAIVLGHFGNYAVLAGASDPTLSPGLSVPEIFQRAFVPGSLCSLLFLSGALVERSLRRPRSSYVISKARRILWPLVVWVLIDFFRRLVFGVGGVHNPQVIARMMLSQRLLWYLEYLLFFYAVALVCRRWRRWIMPAGCLAAALVLDPLSSRLSLVLLYASCFFTGWWIWSLREPRKRVVPWRGPWLLFAAAVGVSYSILTVLRGYQFGYEPFVAPGIFAFVVAASAFSQWVWLTLAVVGRFLEWAGRRSIVIYAAHQSIGAAAFAVAERAFRMNAWWCCLFATCTALLGVLFLSTREEARGWRVLFRSPI